MSLPDWKELQKEATIVDLHIHPSMQQQLFNRNLNLRYVLGRTFRTAPFTTRASFPRLKDGGYDVILSVLHVPEKGLLKDFPIANLFRILRPDLWQKLIVQPPYEATLAIMADFEAAVAESHGYERVQMAHSVNDLTAILSQPKGQRPIAAIHCVEGAHSLGHLQASDEDVMRNLDALFARGVAYITLAHFYANKVTNPVFPFPEDVANLAANPDLWRDITRGLTPLGVKVVERMIELGMLIDLSHSSPAARFQVYQIMDSSSKRLPLLATHVGAYGINPSPYNLTDWEIKRIASDGGVVGVIFMPYWLMPKESGQGINFISRHIQYLIDTAGEDSAAIGTDFDGFTTPPNDLDNASQMARLTQRLVVDGHSRDRILKILGGNALRAVCSGWGKKV
jgi:microsomal dipeptidase-like Zn-dependent dipeptidase